MNSTKTMMRVVGLGVVIAGSLVAVRQCDGEEPPEQGVRQAARAVRRTDHKADSSLRIHEVRREQWLAKRGDYEEIRQVIRKKYEKTNEHYEQETKHLDTTHQALDSLFGHLFLQLRTKLRRRRGYSKRVELDSIGVFPYVRPIRAEE